MTTVEIRRLTPDSASDLNRCDSSFVVDAVLRLRAVGREIRYTVEPVAPYPKRYEPEVYDPQPYVEREDHAAWVAHVDGEVAGQILVRENWNRYAIIWDVAVNPAHRRMGIGRSLLERAIEWARARGLPGVMLETQDTNAGACRLYAACGFRLRRFDTHLYRAMLPGADEIALFWYLDF
jgi:ribosomal protein S18 acetylase RimI-like enzyme